MSGKTETAITEMGFDIFCANDLLHPVQVGSVDNFATARLLMTTFAQGKPGWYFVWDRQSLRILARVDTTRA